LKIKTFPKNYSKIQKINECKKKFSHKSQKKIDY